MKVLPLLSTGILGLVLMLSSCNKKSSNDPTPNNPNNPNDTNQVRDTYRYGLPEVISGVQNGVEAVRYTILAYNADSLPTQIQAYGTDAAGRGTATAVYNSDKTLQTVNFVSSTGETNGIRYRYSGGNLVGAVTVTSTDAADTMDIGYQNGQVAWMRRRTVSQYGSGYYYRSGDSTTYQYDAGNGRLTASYTYLYDGDYNQYQVRPTRTDYYYDAQDRLTQMIERDNYNSRYDESTRFYYIDELMGTHTDRLLKNGLMQFALSNGSGGVPPHFLAKKMGIGALLRKSGKPSDPYVNPYAVLKVSVDSLPAYKILSADALGDYMLVRLKR